VIDEVAFQPDGGHLQALWQRRQPYYPPQEPQLLTRFLVDALKAGPLAVEGHHVVGRYRMEDRIPRVTCPTLVIGATDDPHAYPSVEPLAQAISGARRLDIPGGRVPLPDQLPSAFANAVSGFLGAVLQRPQR
jgi:pimeloyl-ACP methyl ester carboxylesterase